MFKCLALSRVFLIHFKHTFSLMEICTYMYDFKNEMCSFWLSAFSLFLLFYFFSNWVSTRIKQGGDFGWNNRVLSGNFDGISFEREFEVAMYFEFIILKTNSKDNKTMFM